MIDKYIMRETQLILPINDILNKIFNISPKNKIKSVLLIGSAARNEITTILDENGFIVSDIEIIVILKNSFPHRNKNKKLFLLIENYKIEILFTQLLFLKNLKTPLVYDLKTTGKVLWGKDIRNSIWIKDRKEIPYWEGVRILYNRLVPFLVLTWKHINNLPIKKSEEYFATKLLIALDEYLMIKNQSYYSSYKDKLQYLKEKLKKSDIINLIIDALEYKLNIKKEFNNLLSIQPTCIFVYNLLKKLIPYLDNYKPPPSARIIETLKNVQDRNLLKNFSNLKMIQIYKEVFQLLEIYVKSPQKFKKKGKKINLIYKEWKNTMQIQSSYF